MRMRDRIPSHQWEDAAFAFLVVLMVLIVATFF